MKIVILVGVLLQFTACAAVATSFKSEDHGFTVEVIADTLRFPWALQFLPQGEFLVTERPGYLSIVNPGGRVRPVGGVPGVSDSGQGGLLDVHLDPEFPVNHRIYMCYSQGTFSGSGTELASAILQNDHLTELKVLFVAEPKVYGGRHFGCRIEIDAEGHVLLAIGDRGDRAQAQDLSTHHGSIIRLLPDGAVPEDNPLRGNSETKPEIVTWGHRNPQGMTRHPVTGEIWAVEHGPQGGDELNLITPGSNYGWPVVTSGVEYGSAEPIGEGVYKAGMVAPRYEWTPSIAPSGAAVYLGDAFPRWRNSLFVGSLKLQLLVRLEMDGGRVVTEERLLEDALGRIRDVRIGPDGLIYLLTDADPGMLVRLKPVD